MPVSTAPADRVKLLAGARAAGLDTSPTTLDNHGYLLELLRLRRESLHSSARSYVHAIDARLHKTGASSQVPYANTIPSINSLKRDVVKLELIQDAIDVLESEHGQQQQPDNA